MGAPTAIDLTEKNERTEKPEWYKKTIRRFRAYPRDQKKVQILRNRLAAQFPSQTAKYTQAPSFTVGNTGDQTSAYAGKRLEDEYEIEKLERNIRETEIVLGAFGEKERELITRRYFDFYAKDWHVALNLDIPLRSYYRIRDEIILTAADMYLYVKRDQVSFEELGWWD